MTLRMQRK